MRRTVAIAAMASFVLGLLGFVIASALQGQMPSMASETVSHYLRSQNAGSSQPLIVQRTAQSSRPGLFDAGLSSASVGDSIYYGTTRSFTRFVPPDPRLSITPPASGFTYSGGRPLPYPPTELWCLLLGREGQLPAVAFVALHQDMYTAQWVMHEAAGDPRDPAFKQRLATLGCDLGL